MKSILMLIVALTFGSAPAFAQSEAPDVLAAPDSFADIVDETERSVALFNEMGKVLTHPRCLNCHPVTGGPRQGDDMAPHMPPVIRGEADFGAPGMTCNTCHGSENIEFTSGAGSIPGHEPWRWPQSAWAGSACSGYLRADQGPRTEWRKDIGGTVRAQRRGWPGGLGLEAR